MRYANQYEKKQWQNLRNQFKYIYDSKDLLVMASMGMGMGFILGLAFGVSI